MRCCMVLTVVLLLCSFAFGQETISDFSWQQLKEQGGLLSGEVMACEGKPWSEQLKITNTHEKPKTFTLFKIENPGVTMPAYAIVGQVSYENVQGKGYLEMWNIFPKIGKFFSRTLSESGPSKHITDTSDWRDYQLPFWIKDESGWRDDRPSTLTISVFLPGKGTVYLSPPRLVQYDKGGAVAGQWWSARTARFLGAVYGLAGATVGILGGMGIARRVVLTIMKAMIACSLVLVVMAVVALAVSQPFAEWYQPLLAGLIGTIVPASIYRNVRNQYARRELRKISAMDAGTDQ